MEERLRQLEQRITNLERENQALKSAHTFPLDVQGALVARGFFKLDAPLGTGVLYSTNGVISAVSGGSKNVYVATISGGAVNNAMNVTNGIVTSI